ncbi:unnamed protein product [Caretta caretta]
MRGRARNPVMDEVPRGNFSFISGYQLAHALKLEELACAGQREPVSVPGPPQSQPNPGRRSQGLVPEPPGASPTWGEGARLWSRSPTEPALCKGMIPGRAV